MQRKFNNFYYPISDIRSKCLTEISNILKENNKTKIKLEEPIVLVMENDWDDRTNVAVEIDRVEIVRGNGDPLVKLYQAGYDDDFYTLGNCVDGFAFIGIYESVYQHFYGNE